MSAPDWADQIQQINVNCEFEHGEPVAYFTTDAWPRYAAFSPSLLSSDLYERVIQLDEGGATITLDRAPGQTTARYDFRAVANGLIYAELRGDE